MKHRENEAELLEGDEPEENEPNLLDDPDLLDIEEDWQDLIEESITTER